MLTRYSFAAGTSTFVTLSLLFVMNFLIEIGDEIAPERVLGPRLDIVKLEPDKPEEPDRPTLPEPIPDPAAPPPLVIPQTVTGGGIPVNVRFEPPPPPGRSAVALELVSDSDPVPVFRPAPAYPIGALRRGLEGFVVVEYSVLASGATRDVTVLNSSHALFEEAAVEAARRFKYTPRVRDGEAVDTPGLRSRIRFVLSD